MSHQKRRLYGQGRGVESKLNSQGSMSHTSWKGLFTTEQAHISSWQLLKAPESDNYMWYCQSYGESWGQVDIDCSSLNKTR